MGTCSMAPAAALAAVGVMWTARWRGRTTPVTPAPSAERRMAPRLPGSVTPSTRTRNGTRFPVSAGPGRPGPPPAGARPWPAHPGALRCGPRRRGACGSRAAPGCAGPRPGPGSRLGPPRSSPSVATHSSRTLRRPASRSSRTAWRPSTCSPPRPLAAAGRRGGGPPAPRGGRRAGARRGAARIVSVGGAWPRLRTVVPRCGRQAPVITATAQQAMPSRRPSAPEPLGPPTLDGDRARRGVGERWPPSAARWGASFGASQTTLDVDVADLPPGRSAPCRRPRPGCAASPRRPTPGRCPGSAGRGRPARPRRAARRPRRGRPRRRRCGPRGPARPGTARRPGRAGGRGRREKRWTSKPCPTRIAHQHSPATRWRAQARSSGTVSLRLSGSPATTTTRPPAASTSAASSVPSAPAGVRGAQRAGREGLRGLDGDERWSGRSRGTPRSWHRQRS